MKILLQYPILWRLSALAYSAFITVLLVQPSGQPVIGPPAPPGAPTLEREILLTFLHGVVFSLLTLVWTGAFVPGMPLQRALWLAVSIGLTLGLVTELVQIVVPGRGASVEDLAANYLATIGTAWVIYLNRQGMEDTPRKAMSAEP